MLIWEVIFVMLILKLPVAYVCWVIWWAVKAETEPGVEGEPNDSSWMPWRRKPRDPRNGPHGPQGPHGTSGPHGAPGRANPRTATTSRKAAT